MDVSRVLNNLKMSAFFPSQFRVEFCKVINLDPRQVLFKKGESVDFIYLILLGSMRFQSDEKNNDNTVVYAFKSIGSLLGIFSYIEKTHNHTATAVSMENTSLLQIPVDHFLRLVEMNPELKGEVHKQISFNFKELQFDREVQKETTSVRLAHFLIRTLQAQKDKMSRSILMKLTKKDLAKRIGAEPETIVRLLSDWSRKGLINNKNRMIEVCNIEELSKLINE